MIDHWEKNNISIAPMMGYTDKYFYYLSSLILNDTIFYSEMINAGAIVKGKKFHLLDFDINKMPIAIQFGGSDPFIMAEAAYIATEYGFNEININFGCPSSRVANGNFGACLMKDIDLCKRIIEKTKLRTNLPVTIKCRLGVDKQNIEETFPKFIDEMINSDVDGIIIHARIALLNGLSTKENRTIPKINYDLPFEIKKKYPNHPIMINGEVNNFQIYDLLKCKFSNIMIGREAIRNLHFLWHIENRENKNNKSINIINIIEDLEKKYPKENKWFYLRHIFSLTHAIKNGKKIRNYLATNYKNDVNVIINGLEDLMSLENV